jgi:hypothetical protein
VTPEEYVALKHEERVEYDKTRRKQYRAECKCGTLVSRWRATYEEAERNAKFHFENKVRREVQYRAKRG